MYQEKENGSVTHNGKKYNLNSLLRLTHNREISYIPISKLSWTLKSPCTSCAKGPAGWHLERVENADISKPILVIDDDRRLVVLDGVHRLEKAINSNIGKLPARFVEEKDLRNIMQ